MFKRILVPLDGSRFSTRALPNAVEVANRFDAEVVLVRVVTQTMQASAMATPSRGGPAIQEMFIEEARRQDKRNVAYLRRYLQKKLRELAAQGIKGSYHIMVGDPVLSIKEFCQKEDIDLVVMTTHGRGGLKRAILGSVSDEIIRGCGVPVLAIKLPSRRK